MVYVGEATRYEIILEEDGSRELLGFTAQHSAVGIIHFISGRPALSARIVEAYEGTDCVKVGKTYELRKNTVVIAVLRFSGRTQREAEAFPYRPFMARV